jgi:coiled-coil domain-containing protein 55
LILQPRYIAGLLKAAEERKREDERRAEKKVQKEREKEGGEFDDKEVFVTGAYRKKMQDMQALEEKERREAAMEGTGLSIICMCTVFMTGCKIRIPSW